MFLSAFSDDATVAQVKALGAVAYLVKPLDIRQIVPAVEAAFANLGQRGSAAATAAKRGSGAPDPLACPVAIAVGVLMHRYSIDRAAALQRLQRLAQSDGCTVDVQAEQILKAVELLSRPATAP
jgi:response regulator NasT